MNKIKVGQLAPDFTINDQDSNSIKLSDFSSQWLILYFYPKDNTPGCTQEAKDFSENLSSFQALGTTVLGVSPDSEKSHCRFREKHNLSIQLLSDSEHQLAESYGVWRLKKFMGKEYMGVIRSTFLIGPEQTIAYIWDQVKVKGHVEAVLAQLIEAQK